MGLPANVNVQYVQKCSTLFLCSCVVTLFIYLNNVQPHYFIDEVFHVPQTLRYCDRNFTQWDSKITTLPGLYLLTTLILSPLNLCSIFYMRCVNLFGTFVNLCLAYNILKRISVTHWKQRWTNWTKLAVAYNVMLFPPLFFWHFLYYTDVVSVNAILLTLLLHLHKRFKAASFIGFLSVTIRQTNIVWVAFLTMEHAFDLLDLKKLKSVSRKQYTSVTYLKLLWEKIIEEANLGWTSFAKFLIQTCLELLPYGIVCLMFLAFVVWNQGIVIGDRTAHVATVHVLQLLYYSVFLFCFLWPYMIVHLKNYINLIQRHWFLGTCFLVFLAVIIHFNTLVHPYMLADNRHYVFYFWNKFMRKHKLFKYLLIPVYSFTLYAMFSGVKHLRFVTQINYFLMVSLVLVPQLLVEPRYFIIPYILYRLLLVKPKKWQIVMESVTMLIVNFLQFYIFINKVFYWSDQPDPQRISW